MLSILATLALLTVNYNSPYVLLMTSYYLLSQLHFKQAYDRAKERIKKCRFDMLASQIH